MSPACAATIFEGDNGGATSRGVSGTEIRVAVPIPDLSTDRTKPIDALFAYFNQQFELYGRRLVPVYVPGDSGSALNARARAAEAGTQNVFAAVTGGAERYGAQPALAVELARQAIVTVVRGGSSWWSDRTLYDAYDPYVWSVYPSSEDIQANLGDFACTALAHRPAIHAGDSSLGSRTRRFGVLTLGQAQSLAANVLMDMLRSCSDAEPLHADWSQQQSTTVLRTALDRMKSGDGATTLFCICEAGLVQTAIDQAHGAGFDPEWVLAPSFWATGNDEQWVQDYRARNALAPPMRVSAGPRLLPLQARPWFGALQEMLTAPTGNFSLTAGMGEFVYPELLLLAAGIQGAGPMLTASTFQQALITAVFPNPGAGQAPYYQPSAGFGPGDHSFYDDYSVGWWSDTAEAFDTIVGSKAQGSWCYLDRAARFGPGRYPADAEQRMFNAGVSCR